MIPFHPGEGAQTLISALNPHGSAAMETATDIDYDHIEHLLESSALSPTAAEAHGMLCGLICGGDADPSSAWLGQILPVSSGDGGESGRLPDEARDGLEALAARTLDEVHGAGLGFALLLPDESRPLRERATAVYDWVRGFLFALGLLGVFESDLSEQTREVFRDFTDITRMDLDSLDEGEDNEEALTEIVEFLWVAAMLVYEERVAAPAQERGERP